MTALSLTKIGIDGFRGLRELELADLGRINILVGSNNSGKTSVLEAMSIMCQPFNPDAWLFMVHLRDFGGFDESRIQSLRWCFTQSSALTDPEQLIEASCKFSCQGAYPVRELRIQYNEFMGEPPEAVRRQFARRKGRQSELFEFEEILLGAELQHFPTVDTSNKIFLSQIEYYSDFIYKEPPTLRLWEGMLTTRIGRIRNLPKLDAEMLTPYSFQINRNLVKTQSKRIFQQDNPNMLELLRDFDTDIEGIDLASFHGERPSVYIKHSKLGVAPLSVFGDAMRRSVLLAATLLSIKKGGVLLIDEVEVGIHIGALGNVFEWLVRAARQLDVQVFVTTHSLEAVDALISTGSKLEADDVVAFQLSQSEERTCCKRFAGDLLHRLRFERGLDVR